MNYDRRRRNNKGDILKATGNSSKGVFYSTTANEFIINRRFNIVLKKTRGESERSAKIIKAEIEVIRQLLAQQENRTTSVKGRGTFAKRVMLQRLRDKLKTKQQELSKVLNAPTQVLARYKQIKNFGQLGTLIMSNNISTFAAKHYPVDPDDCSTCEMSYTFNPRTYLSTCQGCCRVVSSIFNQEDYSHEVIANKLYSKTSSICNDNELKQVTFNDGKESITIEEGVSNPGSGPSKSAPKSAAKNGGEGEQPGPRQMASKKDSVQQVLKSGTSLASQAANRSALFRKYLSQFLQDSPEIPQEVFHLLYQHLTHGHLHPNPRCKPTPVTSILKNSQFKDLCYMNVKISRMYDGMEVPVIDHDLLNEMVDMYNAIISMDLGKFYREKLYSFEFVAALIFFAKGRLDLCKLIQQNKNKKYFNFQDDAVQHIVSRAKEANPSMDWSRLTALVPSGISAPPSE